MFIKQVSIKNFQSHKDSVINFTEGLNSIVGESDSGKSAVLRAMRWCLKNEQIDNLVTFGETSSEVKIEFNDGSYIVRGRKKADNYYIVKTPTIEEQKFENFGREIPDIVKEVSKVMELVIDKDKTISLNIVTQHDPYFLLGESDSVKNKAINSIVNLNVIDSAIRDVNTDIKKSNEDNKKIDVELETLETEITKIGDVESKLKVVEQIEGLFKKQEELNEKQNKYNDIIIRFGIIEEKEKSQTGVSVEVLKPLVESYQSLLEKIKTLKSIYSRISVNEQKQQSIAGVSVVELSSLLVNYNALLNKLQSCNVLLKQCNVLYDKEKKFFDRIAGQLHVSTDDIKAFNEKLNKLKEMNKMLGVLIAFNEKFRLFKVKIIKIDTDKTTAMKDYLEELERVKVCPLCQSDITSHKIKEIKEKLDG